MAVITQTTREYIPVNEDGYRIGEFHHQARIPEYIIQAILDLRETYNLGSVSYTHLTLPTNREV